MGTSSTHRDPRSVITPDAFDVSVELLGTPLAPPSRRLVALLVDLAFIGFVTLVTRSFALLLGVVAAGLFMRAGFKRTPIKGSVFGRAMRFSVGCLGLFIAAVTAVVWSSCGIDFSSDDPEDSPAAVAGGSAASQIIGALAAVGVANAFEDSETIEEAEDAALELIRLAEDSGIERDRIRDFLTGAVPSEAVWAADAESLFDRLLAGEVEEADPADPDAEERAAAYLVVADTMNALALRIDELQEANRDQQRDLERTTAALGRATSGGFLGWLRTVADDLGFGFGWLTLYWTVLLSSWKGQTIGKRMLGIRVVRLDGERITWWTAFERVGGYAAGFATGLLGFAQVYWDANRQAIHDRIVGTVVVLDGAERVTDWEAAL